MKRLLPLLSLTLLFSACSFGAMHPTIYNNKVVDRISPSTLAVEESALSYNQTIPSEINEYTEIDVSLLREEFNTLEDLIKDVEKALDYQSENLEQQATTLPQIETFILAVSQYMEAYENMLTYFETESHKQDPTKLDTLDPSLHAAYNTFTEANNDLVESLSTFVENEE